MRLLELYSTTATRRLTTIKRLPEVGIHVRVLVTPIIHVLTDGELEKIYQPLNKGDA